MHFLGYHVGMYSLLKFVPDGKLPQLLPPDPNGVQKSTIWQLEVSQLSVSSLAVAILFMCIVIQKDDQFL